MTGWHRTLAWSLALAAAVSGWTAEQQPLALGQAASRSGFRLVDAGHSGATFLNEITVASAAENQVLLNGSGVAAGDYDRDGLPDLYFCGLENDNVLYRNLGGFRFQPVSDDAVTCAGIPSTSAAFADLNGDGHPDLLVGTLGQGLIILMNNAQGGFSRSLAGLPDAGSLAIYSTPLTDIDGDGDLDVYVATYRATSVRNSPDLKFQLGFANNRQTLERVTDSKTGKPYDSNRFYIRNGLVLEAGTPDYLLLNDGAGKFQVTSMRERLPNDPESAAGPSNNWGLGAIFADFNNDHRDDLYVCNDLDGADYFYYATGGGFKNAVPDLKRMTPAFSMGVDVSDVNNDGLSDFIVVDMLNHSLPERKMQIPHDSSPHAPGDSSAVSEYRRNMLFLRNGAGAFDEIAHYSGLESSDWSWSPLFLDVDLDGYQDLLVTNGFSYDLENPDVQRDLMKQSLQAGGRGNLVADSFRIEHSKLDRNLGFRNRGDLTFRERSAEWGFDFEGISHGACLADLDNDGDQDVVLNNFSLYLPEKQILGEPLPRLRQANPVCSIYENLSNSPRVKVRVRSNTPNTHGIGTIIALVQGSVRQTRQIRAGSRYCSSDSAEVTFAWLADRSPQRLEYRLGAKAGFIDGVKPNTLYTITDADFTGEPADPVPAAIPEPLFVRQPVRQSFKHTPAQLNVEFFQPGISRNPYLTEPAVSTVAPSAENLGSVRISNGSNVENIPIGERSAAGSRPAGSSRWNLVDFAHLIVGGKWMRLELQHRLGGQQRFESRLLARGEASANRAEIWTHALPANYACLAITRHPTLPSAALIAVGGASPLGHYPQAANTLILELRLAKLGAKPQLLHKLPFRLPVNDLVFADMDGQPGQELVIAPEGGPITVYQFTGQAPHDITQALGLRSGSGNWNSLACFDFSGNGRNDLLAGNWGSNSPRNRHTQNNLRLYYKRDGDRTRLYETVQHNNKNVLITGLAKFKEHNPVRGLMYRTHGAFRLEGVEDLFETPPKHRPIDMLRTRLFLNRNGAFGPMDLPEAVQFAPTFGIAVEDFNLDGSLDIALCQGFNEFYGGTEPQTTNSHLILLNHLAESGSFEVRRHSGIATDSSYPRVIGTGDFNGDNRPDLIIPGYGAGIRHYQNLSAGQGITLHLVGDSLDWIGLKARMRYRDGSWGPRYEYTPKYGYRKEAPNRFIFGAKGGAEAIEIIGPNARLNLAIVPRQNSYTLAEAKKSGPP